MLRTWLSRPVQAEPNKKPTSVRSPVLLAPVYSRLAVFGCAKNPIRPKIKKSFSQIEAKEKKLRPFQNGYSKSPVRKARTWTRPQPKSLEFGHLPVANSKGEPNFENSLPLAIGGAGRFRRGLAHMKTNISVSFSSAPCLASTVPFPMTSPYVGGASSFFSPFFTHVSRYAPGMTHTGRE